MLSDPPSISLVTPSRVNPALETDITIAGTYFDSDASNTKVYIANSTLLSSPKECAVDSSTTTQITCKLQGAPTGYYSLYVLTSTGYSASVAFEARVLMSVSPSDGSLAGGTVITIQGGLFSTNTSETTVFLGDQGVVCPILTATDTEITCKTKASLSAYAETDLSVHLNTTGLMAVEEAECASGSVCTFAFKSSVTPTITDLNDTTVPQGGALLITGTNFDSRNPTGTDPVATVNGVNCTVLSPSATSIVIQLPTSITATSSANILIYVAGRGYDSGLNTIRVTAELIVSSVMPQQINPNGGTKLTITGSGFPASLAAAESDDLVVVAGSVNCTLQNVTSTQIVCITGAGASNGTLEVRYAEQVQNSLTLTLLSTPANITLLTPSRANSALSTNITITGTNFDDNTDNTQVFIAQNSAPANDYNCTPLTSNSSTITCAIQNIPAGAYNLAVMTSTGYSQSVPFDIGAAITSLSPSNGSTAGGTVLTIQGGPFSMQQNQTIVHIGGDNVVCEVVSVTSTLITCKTEARSSSYLEAAQNISLSTNGLLVDNAKCGEGVDCTFTYLSAITPTVSSLNVTRILPGGVIQIDGNNFDTVPPGTPPLVTVDNQSCTILSATATQIIIQLPSNISAISKTTPVIYIDGRGYANNTYQIRVVTNSSRYWSDSDQWPNSTIPSNGANVIIPSDWVIILDIDTNSLGTLVIEGDLYFDSTATNLTLTAQNIWVKGQLFIGTSATDRYKNSAKIVLTAQSSSQNLSMGGILTPSNKVLAVTGNLSLYGKEVKYVYTRLQAPVQAGDTNIAVPTTIDWKVGDEIFIAPSQRSYSDYETFVITAINNGVITLNQAVSHYHFGATAVTKTVSYGTLDMRAEVGLLTRNIVIQGANEGTWGGRVYVAQNTTSRGRIMLDGVEMINLGQASTKYAGLTFDQLNSAGRDSSLVNSVMRGSSSWQLRVVTSTGITVKNSIFYDTTSNNVRFEGTNTNVQFNDNLVVGTNAAYLSLESTFYSESFITSSVSGNTFAGCSQICMITKAFDCNQATTNEILSNNTVHSGLLGWYVLEDNAICNEANSLVAYKLDVGLLTFSTSLTLEASELIVTDCRVGVSLNTDGYSGATVISLTDSYLAGVSLASTPSAYVSTAECSNLAAVYIPIATEDSKRSKRTNGTALISGLTNVASSAIYQSSFTVDHVTFANFNDSLVSGCSNNYIFRSNPGAIDASAFTSVSNVTLSQVNTDNIVYFSSTLPSLYGACKGKNCTGTQNILIKDLDGSLLSQNASFIPASSTTLDATTCKANTNENANVCSKVGWGLLTFVNLDSNAQRAVLSPVKLSTTSGFSNILYTYTNNIYRSVIQSGAAYSVSSNVVPTLVQWRLQGAQNSDGITIKIPLANDKNGRVEDLSGKVIKQTLINENTALAFNSTDPCGANMFDSQSNTLYVKLTGEASCVLQTRITSSVRVAATYPLRYEAFFEKDGPAKFIELITRSLGDRANGCIIRILGVYRGSSSKSRLLTEDDSSTRIITAIDAANQTTDPTSPAATTASASIASIAAVVADTASATALADPDLGTPSAVSAQAVASVVIGSGLLTFENLGRNNATLVGSPAKISTTGGSSATFTSTSTATYQSRIQAESTYTVTFSTLLTLIKWQLQSAQDADGITVAILIPDGKNVRVEDSSTNIISQTVINEGSTLGFSSDDSCGANMFDVSTNILYIRLTGESTCIIQTRVTNSIRIKATYPISYSDFLTKDGQTIFETLLGKAASKKSQSFVIRTLGIHGVSSSSSSSRLLGSGDPSTQIITSIDSANQNDNTASQTAADADLKALKIAVNDAQASGDLDDSTLGKPESLSINIVSRVATSTSTVEAESGESNLAMLIAGTVIAFVTLIVGFYFAYIHYEPPKIMPNQYTAVKKMLAKIEEEEINDESPLYPMRTEPSHIEEEPLKLSPSPATSPHKKRPKNIELSTQNKYEM